MLRSLLRATTDVTRRAFAWSLEDLSPPQEQTLFRFASQADLSKWVLYSDSQHGGLSRASLAMKYDGNTTAVFSGNLSVEIMESRVGKPFRSGFSGIRTIQTSAIFDLGSFDTIALRLKGDGRCYVSTLRTECWAGGADDMNSWQAFVFAPKDEWCEVKIPFDHYLPTWKGRVINTKIEMNLARICGLTLAVTADGGPEGAIVGPGKFCLELDWIKALRCLDG